jgi:hypothetical protein
LKRRGGAVRSIRRFRSSFFSFRFAVIEDEIHPVVGVVESDAVLSADEGEAFA